MRGKSAEQSAAEVREEPEDERKGETENDTGDDREIKRGVFAAVDDVAGEFTEAEGKLAAEIKQRADDSEERSEDEKGAAKFAEGIHYDIIEESEPPSAAK